MAGPRTDEVLDLAFLERQTFGDRDLQRELLALFEQQCFTLLPVLLEMTDPSACAHAAHTLKGCAAAIGAGRIVRSAAMIEQAIEDGEGAHQPQRTAGLNDAVQEAKRAIMHWRQKGGGDLAKGREVA